MFLRDKNNNFLCYNKEVLYRVHKELKVTGIINVDDGCYFVTHDNKVCFTNSANEYKVIEQCEEKPKFYLTQCADQRIIMHFSTHSKLLKSKSKYDRGMIYFSKDYKIFKNEYFYHADGQELFEATWRIKFIQRVTPLDELNLLIYAFRLEDGDLSESVFSINSKNCESIWSRSRKVPGNMVNYYVVPHKNFYILTDQNTLVTDKSQVQVSPNASMSDCCLYQYPTFYDLRNE